MCARFEQDTKVFTLAFAHGWLAADDINDVDVRDDVRPTNRLLAVGDLGDGLKLHGASWGWPKPASMGKGVVVNAMTEKLATSSFWRLGTRCWIPASAWFEWTGPVKAKVRHRFALSSGEPFLLAGLARVIDDVVHVVVVTQPAPAALSHIHDRAPVPLDFDCAGGADRQVMERIVAA